MSSSIHIINLHKVTSWQSTGFGSRTTSLRQCETLDTSQDSVHGPTVGPLDHGQKDQSPFDCKTEAATTSFNMLCFFCFFSVGCRPRRGGGFLWHQHDFGQQAVFLQRTDSRWCSKGSVDSLSRSTVKTRRRNLILFFRCQPFCPWRAFRFFSREI